MNIFKRKKKTKNLTVDEVIDFIEKHRKTLSKKCRKAYGDGNVSSGRWWDCQACAMITLVNELKKEFKR